MKGLLLVVSGPSGVGKGTLLGALVEKRQDCVFSVSATTRAPRPGEEDGEHYYFLAEEMFERWVEEKRFLEWNKVFDRFYGTPKEPIEAHRLAGKHVILDVDVQGGLQLMREAEDLVTIFIVPPDLETLRERLERRGTETPDQIRRRLLTARNELKSLDHYGYTIVNDDLEVARAKLEAIIEAEMCLTRRLRNYGGIPGFESL